MEEKLHKGRTITWINDILKFYKLQFKIGNPDMIGVENIKVDYVRNGKSPYPLVGDYKYHFNTNRWWGHTFQGFDCREDIANRKLVESVQLVNDAISDPKNEQYLSELALKNLGIGMHSIQDISSHQDGAASPHPHDGKGHLAKNPFDHIFAGPNRREHSRPDQIRYWSNDVQFAEIRTKKYFLEFLRRIPASNPCIGPKGRGRP